MLPAHPHSGYCDIQGRRRTIEDFHAIRLLPAKQYYGIFDGHTGNLASKYVASFLFDKLDGRLSPFLNATRQDAVWKETVRDLVTAVFDEIHREFLAATSLVPHAYMDQSGTTATTAFVTSSSIVIASLGDSRSIISHYDDAGQLTATQLTKDHVASDPREKALVEARGGRVVDVNGISRVEGLLVITRSIGGTAVACRVRW
jgi:serine/threonine protein phosphatase PrpC